MFMWFLVTEGNIFHSVYPRMRGKTPPKSLPPQTENFPAQMYNLSQCFVSETLKYPGQEYKVAGRYDREGRKAGVGPNGKVRGHRFWREQAEKVRLGWDVVWEALRD